jgi:phosphoglycolate/pyridoxal phosphate phosphatase family enzyme
VFVFDIDGVLYRGTEAIDGAAQTLARLRQRSEPAQVFFLTNNSSQPRQVYVDKLTGMGMPCTEDEIVTSASATAAYIAGVLGAKNASALVVGGPGIEDELSRVGLTVQRSADEETGETVDFVVAGLDREFTYHKLWRAQQAILRGAKFIATNRDGQYPMEEGRVIPGGGAMIAAIEAASDTVPQVIGKPETLGLQTILHTANARPDEAVMVGDRCDTDILCGNRLHVPTVLVLTGVTTREKADLVPPDQRPTHIIETLYEL